ncbi:hypothetical protein Taro_047795 [Colocasia esculenta]|uniref:SLC26A/SulP transporter domain-containing protein n=1 Tax=Colocasia esculenta TaxID=4460 RepID=A0A843X810_COLES|nr:hypothetical protein [Colocasia esculenta]
MEISYATSSNVDMTGSLSGLAAGGSRPVKVIPLQHPAAADFGTPSPPPVFARWRSKLKGMSGREWVELLLPCSRWVRSYKWREYFQVDLMAGITVGVMLVPQAMSYAKLAGLHPIYGLYSGFIPIFIYAIFGSSRQLAIGPVALVSLLVSNVLGNIVDSSDKLYTELAILLAFMVGVLECIMGLLRLGWLIRFISHSVISGFTTSSAIVIALSQAKYFLGYSIVRSSKIVPLVKSIIAGAGNVWSSEPAFSFFLISKSKNSIWLSLKQLGAEEDHRGLAASSTEDMKEGGVSVIGKLETFNLAQSPILQFSWPPFVMGSSMLAMLLLMKHLGKTRKSLRILRAAGPLTAVVGEIPQGLPKFSIPKEFSLAKSLIPTAILITGVAILESVGIAKALAAKNGYELDSNQELFGLGVANICGSFFSAYPTTGSFSRSAVNHESGAKTGLSGIIMGIIMGCALMFLTPLFREIPQVRLL